MDMQSRFGWAERLSPDLLKSPWWIGHIPFAYEVVGRLKPRVLVELGTYSGSSFAAFCQAAVASGAPARCYGVDLWEGDVHMGAFDETLYNDIHAYVSSTFPGVATLVRKSFDDAVKDFSDGTIDLLHIDGTHTFEAVRNDFETWLPKMSERGVVLFHDVNVNEQNTGPSAAKFGVRKFFDTVKDRYPCIEFDHCWGLGVLVVGSQPAPEVMELVALSADPAFRPYFEAKGGAVSQRFADMNVALPVHSTYRGAPIWRRAVNKAHRSLQRLREMVR